MTRQSSLQHCYVEFIPETLENGILYISNRFRTASHLCCCGCGQKVVTPLNPAKWKLTDHGSSVSLYPSVGNWSFSCKSHYWVDYGRIKWAERMSNRKISQVRKEDRLDAELYAKNIKGFGNRFTEFLKQIIGNF